MHDHEIESKHINELKIDALMMIIALHRKIMIKYVIVILFISESIKIYSVSLVILYLKKSLS